MPTVTYTVQAGLDDTYYYQDGPTLAYCYNAAAFLYIYYWAPPLEKTRIARAGIRFTGVALQGSRHIITGAYLRLRAYASSTTQVILITGHDENNTADYTAPNCNPDNRAKTTATVNWTTGGLTSGSWYNSDDLSAIVQEIIDRPAFGGPLGFALGPWSDKESSFYSFEGGNPPELHITYENRFAATPFQGYML